MKYLLFIFPVDEVYLDTRQQLNRIKRGHLAHKQVGRDIEMVRIRLGKELETRFLSRSQLIKTLSKVKYGPIPSWTVYGQIGRFATKMVVD